MELLALKDASDEEIVNCAEGMASSLRSSDRLMAFWFHVLSWSDTQGSRAQRRLLRQSLRDQGFLTLCVEKFVQRKPGSHSRYIVQLLHMFGEQLEDRVDLFQTTGLVEMLIHELSTKSQQYFDAIQLFWGLLEEPSVAAKYASLAREFVDGTDASRFDSAQVWAQNVTSICLCLTFRNRLWAVLLSLPRLMERLSSHLHLRSVWPSLTELMLILIR